MPKLPNEDTQRWVRFWVRSVRPDSTVRKLKRADRCIFYEYIALARWQPSPPRLRGCLCHADGRPWTRKERAEAVAESYGVVKAAEEAMQEAGLITFHEGAAAHHSSKGRLRIVNYDRYQGSINGEETASKSGGSGAEQPSNLKANAFKSEGCIANQPSNLKADSSDKTAFNSEGTNTERSTGASADADETGEETAFNSEGSESVEVNDVNNIEVQQQQGGHSIDERQDFWGCVQTIHCWTSGVPDVPAVYDAIRDEYACTDQDLALEAARQAKREFAGRPADDRQITKYLCATMAGKQRDRRERMEQEAPTETDASRPHWTLRMTDEDTRRAEEIAAQMYEQEQRELGRLPAEEEPA